MKFAKKNILLLISVFVLFGALSFFSYKTIFSQTALPECSSLATNIKPGNNCLFYGKKLCSATPSTSYTIDPANIETSPSARENCLDLKDLPLCNQVPNGSQALPGQNCVRSCKDIPNDTGLNLVRGQDYAIHNRDCVRFCDEITYENTTYSSNLTASNNSCVAKKCHQLDSNITPTPGTNCDQVSCNLLSNFELITTSYKIQAASASESEDSPYQNNFCNGQTDSRGKILKCYRFSEEQLPYVIRDKMCVIHNCAPSCSSYQSATDENADGVLDEYDNNDTLNILNKSSSYLQKYQQYINGGFDISDNSACSPITCRPVIQRTYRCTTNGSDVSGNAALDIVRNSSCDTTGNGSVCRDNYCYKVIDCNLIANAQVEECVSSSLDNSTIGSTEDTMNSWFYRPKPMGIATNGNGQIRSPMGTSGNELCYTANQLKQHTNNSGENYCLTNAGRWGWDGKIDLGLFTINLGYFHSSICPDQTRSPGLCGKPNLGGRGTGYIYLCYGDNNPNSGNFYSKVSDQTAYYKGYVQSTYTTTDGEHKVVLCLRFRNGLRPDDGSSETCGRRQCAINCAGFAGGCSTQNCGADVCKELTIRDSRPDECKMDNSLFTDSENQLSKGCMSVIDNNLRLRIQKFGNKICGFLDVKGHLAYETNFFVTGTEKTANNFCLDGSTNSSCNAKNTNDDEDLATRWRTINFAPHIPYIQNNQNGNLRGYFDKQGQFFEEQDCIKVPLRVSQGRNYMLANSANMPRLFNPPLYISGAMIKKGGTISIPETGSDFGETDFNEPEIEVAFGTTRKKLNLAINKTGYEEGAAVDQNSTATIQTTSNSIDYSAEIFARKEHESSTKKPTFCLYRKLVSTDGQYLEPEKIECVYRKLPEIKTIPQKIIVAADPTNTFTQAKIRFRYLASYGANNQDNNCSSDDSCTNEVTLENTDISTPTCTDSMEKYNVCVQRDPCSKINNECISNEINIQNARAAGQSFDSLLIIRNECNRVLLPSCNAKKGINSTTNSSTILSNETTTNPIYYGWFNEICLVSGANTTSFDSKLRDIIAYRTNNSLPGKCIINPSSPYLTDNNPNTNCDSGGKAPNCLCLEYVEGTTLDSQYEYRRQTRREAGLCVDFPVPQSCSAISYSTTSPAVGNEDFINSSLNQNVYGTSDAQISNVVHISHKNRSLGVGQAEFPTAILGMNAVEGSCRGFWKKSVSLNQVELSPTRSCLNNNGQAVWDSQVINACVRYSCSEIVTLDPDINGNYLGNYGSQEILAIRGQSHGYAMWPAYTKTNDFVETVTATSCITGFKKKNSTATRDASGKIVSYSGGLTPSRTCNQIGSWGTPDSTKVCERITCSAVNPPANPTTNSDWAQWTDSGGATFGATPASRSSSQILTESVQYGVCNNDLGFYQLGGQAPSRECDHLGNWKPVKNPCSTRCQAITREADALHENHGNAYWNEANPAVGTELEVAANSCVNGYVPYPYPPNKTSEGVKYSSAGTAYRGKTYRLSDSGVNYDTVIPLTVSLDNRTANALPKRFCKLVAVDGVTSNYWYAASSTCINACPGSDQDERIGVGRTKHNTINGERIISWPETSLGHWSYVSSFSTAGTVDSPNLNGQEASLYSDQGRTNGHFMVARKCGANGKWEDPVPQCVTNNGSINGTNALYNNSANDRFPSSNDSKTLNIGETTTSSSCSTGFDQDGKDSPNGLSPISSFTCEYSDNNRLIDQTYFKYKEGSACVKYCKATAGQFFGTIDVNGTTDNVEDDFYPMLYAGTSDAFVKAGNDLTLECNEDKGYGRQILVTTGSTDVSSCGRTNKLRSSNAPKVKCESSGNFSTTISNSCDKCRSCDDDSDINIAYHNANKTDSYNSTPSCIGHGTGVHYQCYYIKTDTQGCEDRGYLQREFTKPTSMTHGKTIYTCYQVLTSNDSTGAFGLRCLDGVIDVRVACNNEKQCSSGSNTWFTSEDTFPTSGNGMDETKF